MTQISSDKTRELKIQKGINSVPAWWHNIEIEGQVTPGITPMASQDWIESEIPKDLSGLDVLDIGAWDGYYSFLAEKRGARRVVAIDAFQGPCRPNGFKVAKTLLKSKVEHKNLDVYQLDKMTEKFDVIFFFGVYYHLEDPILALYRIFNRLKPGGLLLLEGLVRSGSEPYLYFYRPGVDLSPGDFCAATVPWLVQSCERIGFSNARFCSRYAGDNRLERPVRTLAWNLGLHMGRFKRSHRAIIRAERPKQFKFDKTDHESRDAFLAQHLLKDC